MEHGFVTLRICLLAFGCLSCLSAEPISSKVSRYVDYLKEISSFLLSLCLKDQGKTEPIDLKELDKFSKDKGGGDGGGGLSGDHIGEIGGSLNAEKSLSSGIFVGFGDKHKESSGTSIKENGGNGIISSSSSSGNGSIKDSSSSYSKGSSGSGSYSGYNYKPHKINKPYFQDIEDDYSEEYSTYDDFTIEPYMTKRCNHAMEKPLITKFNIMYRDNETTPGYDCTHIRWRIYSHIGRMKIIPVHFSIHHSMRSYKYQHINSKNIKKDKKTTVLTVYDGFDEKSPILLKSSNKGNFPLYKAFSSTKKRIFVKLTSGSFPTGWEFILKVETIKEKNEYMRYDGYKSGDVNGRYGSTAADGKSMFSVSKSTMPLITKLESYDDLSKVDISKEMVQEDVIKPQQELLLYSLQNKTEEIKQEPSLEDFEQLEKNTNNKKSTIIETPYNHQQQHQILLLQQQLQQQQYNVDGVKEEKEEKRESHFGIIPGLKLEGERRLVEGCEGIPMILSTNYGALYSPNFHLATGYPSNVNCSWLITVDPGNIISLKFVNFTIEPPFPLTSLCFDTLRIYDGPCINQKTLKETYCGNKLPKNFISSTNQLFINFQSDSGMNNWSGFAIKYNSQVVIQNKTVNPQCGHPKTQPSIYSRIVGGIQAKPHSWPWQISLQYEGNHICGACLLTSRWAVTAAHCIVDLDEISHLFLRLGEHNLTMVEGTEETRQIDGWHIHPNYNTNTNDFDLALIHLDHEVSFNDYVMPACLPSTTMSFNNLICIVAGWGTTKDTQFNVVLNQLTVLFIEPNVCNDRKWYDGRVTKNMFCAGYKEGRRDSCQGDSGGPLVCSDGKLWSIYGVISWGFDCAQPRRPGVYTNVTLMQDWIIDQIEESPDHF